MKKLAIIGPGLLGGSLALAVRARDPDCRIAIWARREAAAEEVRQAGIADLATTALAPVVEDADLIVFCVPVGAMRALAEEMAPFILPDAAITDVGSVKGPVVEALAPVFQSRGRFVGSHPMAGSEQSGLAAAHASLFENAVCIVTPHAGADPDAVRLVADFWAFVGGHVQMLSPEEHDRTISLVSHLPHLLAAVLVDFVCAENPNSINFCGNGFRDTTRVASGPPGMWTEILLANRAALGVQIDGLMARLAGVRHALARGDDTLLHELLTNAKHLRDRSLKKDN